MILKRRVGHRWKTKSIAARLTRRLCEPSALTVASSYGIQFLNILTGTLLARGLSPDGRGVLAAAVMWPPVIQAFLSLGLPDVINVFMSKAKYSRERVLGAAIVSAGTVAILTVAVCIFLLPTLVPSSPAYLVRLYGLYPILALSTMVASQALLGIERITQYNRVRVALQLVTAGALVVLYVEHRLTPLSAICAYLAAELVVSIYAWCALRVRPVFTTATGIFSSMAKFGSATHLSFVSTMLADRGQLLVLGIYLPPAKLGLFVVATAFVSPISIIGASLAPILMGRAARSSRGDAVTSFIPTAIRTGVLSILATVIIIPAVKPATNLLFGGEYSGVVPVAIALCLVAPIQGVNRVLTAGLQASGVPFQVGIVQIAGASLGMFSLVPAVSRFGLIGAAAAIALGSVSCSLGLVLCAMHVRRSTVRVGEISGKADSLVSTV